MFTFIFSDSNLCSTADIFIFNDSQSCSTVHIFLFSDSHLCSTVDISIFNSWDFYIQRFTFIFSTVDILVQQIVIWSSKFAWVIKRFFDPTKAKWNIWERARILESSAGCRTIFLFAVFCKIGALECNTYWFHV